MGIVYSMKASKDFFLKQIKAIPTKSHQGKFIFVLCSASKGYICSLGACLCFFPYVISLIGNWKSLGRFSCESELEHGYLSWST